MWLIRVSLLCLTVTKAEAAGPVRPMQDDRGSTLLSGCDDTIPREKGGGGPLPLSLSAAVLSGYRLCSLQNQGGLLNIILLITAWCKSWMGPESVPPRKNDMR